MDKMQVLCRNHPDLKKKFEMFRLEIEMMDKPFPLDYIMELPKRLKRQHDETCEHYLLKIRLENKLKNVSMRIFDEVK